MRRRKSGTVGRALLSWMPGVTVRPAMTRARFWSVFVVLSVAGVLVALPCMYSCAVWGEVVLAAWTAAWLAAVAPAVLRRCADARLTHGFALVALVPLFVAAAVWLVVPMVGVHQDKDALYAAVYFSFVVWLIALAPLLFVCSMAGSRRDRSLG